MLAAVGQGRISGIPLDPGLRSCDPLLVDCGNRAFRFDGVIFADLGWRRAGIGPAAGLG